MQRCNDQPRAKTRLFSNCESGCTVRKSGDTNRVVHGLPNDHRLPTTAMCKIPGSQAPCVSTLGQVPRTCPYWARLR
eukprot:9030338-Pyramimonas_sp.AAC.1